MNKTRFTGKQIKSVRIRLGISQEELARLLGKSWATVSRWERNIVRPTPEDEAKVDRLIRLATQVGRALTTAEFKRFLATPHPLLRGYPPVDLLQSEYSFDDLIAFVESAKSGDMA